MGRRIAVVIDGEKQVLAGKTDDEEGSTGADQGHTAQDHSQSDVAAAIVSLTNEYRARDEESQRKQQKSTCWVRAGTIFVALYTGLTFFQSCVTWKTLKHAIDTSHLDQQAWVSVSGVELAEAPKAGEKILFIIKMQNTGRTPALRVSNRIRFSTTAPETLDDFIYASKEEEGRVVPPGDGTFSTFFYVPDEKKDEALTEEQVASIMNRTTSLYLYGVVLYEDIFKAPHFTRFCGVYIYDKKAPTVTNFCKQKDHNYME
jgi:hypothetical protein